MMFAPRAPQHRIAFYAPLKPPSHPVPSGDRAMARNLMALLQTGGAEVILASELRGVDKHGDPAVQAQLDLAAQAEVARLLLELPKIDLWLTYHNYYKAPDLIGPAVAQARKIPYVQIESTRAKKRLTGPWADFARKAHVAADQADAIFYLTEQDRQTLERDRCGAQQLVWLPPFLPRDDLPERPPAVTHAPRTGPILAVGMMRAGDKRASYRLIAETLAHLPAALPSTEHKPGASQHAGERADDWQLMIAGDGPARAEVEALMAPFEGRVRFLGQLDQAALRAAYDAASLFLWPGVNEAFGMVYLEAQAHGLPIVAQNRPGLRDVLAPANAAAAPTPEDGAAGLAQAISALRHDPALAQQRSQAGRAHIAAHHLQSAAQARLWSVLSPLIEKRS